MAKMLSYRIRFTFAGLNFRGFRGQHPSAKVSSCENLDVSGNEFGNNCVTKMQKWWRFTRATGYAAKNFHLSIDYINTTRIQRKRRIEKSKTKTLHL